MKEELIHSKKALLSSSKAVLKALQLRLALNLHNEYHKKLIKEKIEWYETKISFLENEIKSLIIEKVEK